MWSAINAIRRNDHRNALAGAVAGIGAAIAIGGMEWLSLTSHYPLVIIPFATSIVLVVESLEAETGACGLRSFLLPRVLADALLLTAFAYVWHRGIRRRPWP